MATYETFPQFKMGLDGDAEVRDDETIVVLLPAETLQYDGDTIIYQDEWWYDPGSLSDLERRERPLEDLAAEYAELIEGHGRDGLALIDGDADQPGVRVHGKVLYRGGSAASVRPLPADVERDVLVGIDERTSPPP